MELLEGITRGLTFIFTAFLAYCFFSNNIPSWITVLIGGGIALCAYLGWD